MASQFDTQWNQDDTEIFLKYGAAFVPHRTEQFRTVCTLIAEAKPQRVIDLCCGEGDLSRTLLEHMPALRIDGFDASEQMLAAARASLAQYGDRFRTQQFNVHDRAWQRGLQPVDAFVSSLALHHLTTAEKPLFYRDLFGALTPGGVFVNADLVLPSTAAGLAVAADAWDRAVRSYGATSGMGNEAFNAFEALRWNLFRYPEDNDTDYPLTIAQEFALLTAAGFTHVDLHWMYGGHAIWGGRKR